MNRLTLPLPGGGTALAPEASEQDALRRLRQYEDLHQSLETQLSDTLQKLNSLRAQDKTKTVTYRQLLGQKMTLRDLLSRMELYVR